MSSDPGRPDDPAPLSGEPVSGEPLSAEALVPAEARSHQGHRAGFVSRSLAAFLDLVVVAFLLALGYAGWCMARFVLDPQDFSFPAPPTSVQLVCYEVVAVVYLTAGWATVGCSQGQQVLGLRVDDRLGHRLGPVRALGRAVVCMAFPVGLLGVLLSDHRRAFHDVLLGTSVTYAWTSVRS